MKTGDTVRVKQPVIQGQVLERRINPGSDELELLVAYSDGEGPHQRWFAEGLLEPSAPQEQESVQ